MEKIQSDSRCLGTNMTATVGELTGRDGESRTAIRRCEVGPEPEGLGKVKEMNRDGAMVSNVALSTAMDLSIFHSVGSPANIEHNSIKSQGILDVRSNVDRHHHGCCSKKQACFFAHDLAFAFWLWYHVNMKHLMFSCFINVMFHVVLLRTIIFNVKYFGV